MNSYKDFERIVSLLMQERHSCLSKQEIQELEQWKIDFPELAARALRLLHDDQLPQRIRKLEASDLKIRKKLLEHNIPADSARSGTVPPSAENDNVIMLRSRRLFSRKWLRYAAAIVFLAGAAFIFRVTTSDKKPLNKADVVDAANDILPGRDKAVLTLADGSKIVLDNVAEGQIGRQGDISILKLPDGALKYQEDQDNPAAADAPVSYNTITTPNAGQYALTLPDGSGVWLNAASSMTFPTRFNKAERRLSITGEVYFEVARDAARPFIVQVNKESTVEVLGTHFNINAYSNEPSVKTTLLEGKVSVKKGGETGILLPGQQAIITDKITLEKNVDVEQVMAWKNGFFNFEQVDLSELMRQLERWYDIKVVLQGNLPEIRFKGKMYRNERLSTVLNFLEGSGLAFRMEGKTLTVQQHK
ncbi:MAG: FecR domain-containing protein [Sphingobacteriales bacterium]|nr:FecR domain-containing protein [Sphingobacteriales bacterium]OJY87642.1 MAG: hypothetical protein BGP14_12840 [Sphingobacteriales bacterium 44-15]